MTTRLAEESQIAPKLPTVMVMTANMGSCQCGHCWCEIRKDGMIRYHGRQRWQQSDWQDWRATFRPYRSELSREEFDRAIKTLNMSA